MSSAPIPVICDYCSKPIDGVMVCLGEGRAHPHCYYRKHPPRFATRFAEVIRGDEPVLGCQVAEDMIPQFSKEKIVNEFNERLKRLHERRCAAFEDGEAGK